VIGAFKNRYASSAPRQFVRQRQAQQPAANDAPCFAWLSQLIFHFPFPFSMKSIEEIFRNASNENGI
jgi:hypothetical protein